MVVFTREKDTDNMPERERCGNHLAGIYEFL
jgi:hypothetical protein